MELLPTLWLPLRGSCLRSRLREFVLNLPETPSVSLTAATSLTEGGFFYGSKQQPEAYASSFAGFIKLFLRRVGKTGFPVLLVAQEADSAENNLAAITKSYSSLLSLIREMTLAATPKTVSAPQSGRSFRRPEQR